MKTLTNTDYDKMCEIIADNTQCSMHCAGETLSVLLQYIQADCLLKDYEVISLLSMLAAGQQLNAGYDYGRKEIGIRIRFPQLYTMHAIKVAQEIAWGAAVKDAQLSMDSSAEPAP